MIATVIEVRFYKSGSRKIIIGRGVVEANNPTRCAIQLAVDEALREAIADLDERKKHRQKLDAVNWIARKRRDALKAKAASATVQPAAVPHAGAQTG